MYSRIQWGLSQRHGNFQIFQQQTLGIYPVRLCSTNSGMLSYSHCLPVGSQQLAKTFPMLILSTFKKELNI